MDIELDHLFICTAPGAPEADELVRFGLREGPPNQHPGQGTANRRFSFANAMIELFWVSDPAEAQSESTRRTLLWERWSGRESHASPFGICVRPADPQHPEPPFPAWEYRPSYLPDPLAMHIAEAGIEEPMWVHMSFMRRAHREQNFIEHPIGVREITGLILTTPVPLRSAASQSIVENKILSIREGPKPFLEIEFDGAQRHQTKDFGPHLPLAFYL
jgi:hypothetical protein